ncbi:Hypothetical_protein [Hexamita inflata]|uniref:Hypothetical_protein n=1 Tax=Hexamita inflata TaxID=28002 RepID=A0AA86RB01_9EUKA|nr:Hypothetical protein HINF_LOCUS60477 [Hexamita inflata]
MKKLKIFRAELNRLSDLSSIQKHPNFNNRIDINGERCFYISHQIKPFKIELRKANKIRSTESPNCQLKKIQNLHKSLQTTLNNCKQQINTINNARQNQIQFTSNVVLLFQQLNQVGFE